MRTSTLITASVLLLALSVHSLAQEAPEAQEPTGDWVEVKLADGSPAGFWRLFSVGEHCWGSSLSASGWILHQLSRGKATPVKDADGEVVQFDFERCWQAGDQLLIAGAVEHDDSNAGKPSLYHVKGSVAEVLDTPEGFLDDREASPRYAIGSWGSPYLSMKGRDTRMTLHFDGEELTQLEYPIDDRRFSIVSIDGDRVFAGWPLGLWMYDGRKWVELKDEDGDPIRGWRTGISSIAGDYIFTARTAHGDEYGLLRRLDGGTLRQVDLGDGLYASGLTSMGERVFVTTIRFGQDVQVRIREMTPDGLQPWKELKSAGHWDSLKFYGNDKVGFLIGSTDNNHHYYRVNPDVIVPLRFPGDAEFPWNDGAAWLDETLVLILGPSGLESPWQPIQVARDGIAKPGRDQDGELIVGGRLHLGTDGAGIYASDVGGADGKTWYLEIESK